MFGTLIMASLRTKCRISADIVINYKTDIKQVLFLISESNMFKKFLFESCDHHTCTNIHDSTKHRSCCAEV